MGIVSALLLLLGQPTTDTTAIDSGATAQPQSGGIPTTPPPSTPPTKPY